MLGQTRTLSNISAGAAQSLFLCWLETRTISSFYSLREVQTSTEDKHE